MKKILFLLLAFTLCASTALAAHDIPPGYPPPLGRLDASLPPPPALPTTPASLYRKSTILAPRSCR